MKEIQITKYETTDGKVFESRHLAQRWQDILDDPNKRVCPRCIGKGTIQECTNAETINAITEQNEARRYSDMFSGPIVSVPDRLYATVQCPACKGPRFQELKGVTEPKEIWE